MGRMLNFEQDLSVGHQTEKEVLYFLKKIDKDAHQVEGYHKEYDIICPNWKRTFEVKNDIVSNKTQRVGIETEYNGNPSGINTTKADYWVIKTLENYYVINTQLLKNLIKFKRNNKYLIQNKQVKMKFLPIQELIDNSIRVFLGTKLNGGKQCTI